MYRSRKAAILLLLAGAAFLLSAFLDDPRRPLGLVAGGLLLLVGILRFARSRRV
jgi:hypothetical protein